jgi:hypothetical protein
MEWTDSSGRKPSGDSVREFDPAKLLKVQPPELQDAVRLTVWENGGVPALAWEQASTEERRWLAGAAVRARANADPQGAIAFFNEMASAERSLESWYEAGNAFMKVDPQAASQWMKELPNGAERDAAVTALVAALTNGSPETRDGRAAALWAGTVRGNVEREQLSDAAFQVWVQQDWLAASNAMPMRVPIVSDPAKKTSNEGGGR